MGGSGFGRPKNKIKKLSDPDPAPDPDSKHCKKVSKDTVFSDPKIQSCRFRSHFFTALLSRIRKSEVRIRTKMSQIPNTVCEPARLACMNAAGFVP